MANEIQKYTFSAVPTGGSWRPVWDGNAAPNLHEYGHDDSFLLAVLEAISGIGSGNVSVSGSFADGFTVEFVGALVNADLAELSYQDNTLSCADTTLAVQTLADGDGGSTNESQRITHSANGGSYTISWGALTTAIIPWDVDYSTLFNILSSVFGVGNFSLSAGGSDYTIDWFGSYAGVDIPTPTFSNSLTQGVSISVTTLQNGSPPPSLDVVASLSASTTSIAENGGSVSILALLSETASETVTIAVGFAGSAATGSDYTLSTDTITIASGQTSGSITATAVNDSVYEGDEDFTASITSVSGGGASASSTASTSVVTIVDDESPPVVNLSQSTTSIAENLATAYVVARLANASYQNVTVNFGFSGSATLNTDYSASSNSLVVTAGSTSGSISISAIQDSTHEGNETILVGIASVTNGSAGATSSLSITLVDDDSAPPVVSLTSSLTSIDENAGSTVVRAIMSATHSATVTVTLGFAGTATSTTDYTRTTDTIVMTSGQTSGSVGITSIQDVLSESNETITVSIASVTSGISSSSDTITITIVNEGVVTNEVGMASTKRSLIAKNAPPIEAVVSCGVISDWIDICTAPEASDNSGGTVVSPGSISRTDQKWIALCSLGSRLLVRLKYDAGVTLPTSPVVQVFGKDSQGTISPLTDASGTHEQALTIDLTNDVTDGAYKYTTAKTLNIAGCKDVLAAIKTAFAGTGTTNNSAIQVRVI